MYIVYSYRNATAEYIVSSTGTKQEKKKKLIIMKK